MFHYKMYRTMKKTYISPVLETMTMEVKPLCNISGGKTDLDSEHKVGAGSSLGRSFDFTEDE